MHEGVESGTVAGAWTVALRTARKAAVLVLGGTVLGIGVALIVLPGPAFLVIPAGLGILATEFVWARRLLLFGKERGARLLAAVRARLRVRGVRAPRVGCAESRPVQGA